MREVRGWESWESEVNKALSLSSTAGSGSQAHDPGDGTDRRHHSETDYAIQADAKFTQGASFSVNARVLKQWSDRALAQGKRFILPVRVWRKGLNGPDDYVVVPWQDYLMLVETYREHERGLREGDCG